MPLIKVDLVLRPEELTAFLDGSLREIKDVLMMKIGSEAVIFAEMVITRLGVGRDN